MKKLFIVSIFFSLVLFLYACEKTPEEDSLFVNIDLTEFMTADEILFSVVPSDMADNVILTFSIKVSPGEINQINLPEKSDLKEDAYFSIIVFDNEGKFLTQNFFSANEKDLRIK